MRKEMAVVVGATALASAVVLGGCSSGGSSDKGNSATANRSEEYASGGLASKFKVVVDGQDQGINGGTCNLSGPDGTMVGLNAWRKGAVGPLVSASVDFRPPDQVPPLVGDVIIKTVNNDSVSYLGAAQGRGTVGAATANRNGNTYTISGTAQDDGSSTRPVKAFEITFTCP